MRPDEIATIDRGVDTWSEIDLQWMRRALELAASGSGQVSPSPLVGCVIADAGGEKIGEGFYLYERIKHAETLALEEAGTKAVGATAYVSLEPHAHHGRTPPCTDALIRAGVKRVVAPIEDPNPKVSGKGFAHLRAAGLRVETGLLAQAASRLNEKYIHFMRHARPFVHLKLACSLDGRIATRTGDSRWITGEQSRARVHELRHEYDAIMVGSNTAINDNPLLTDRSGKPRRLPLTRVLLDPSLQLSTDSQLALTVRDAPVLVFTSESADASAVGALERRGIVVLRESDGRNLNQILTQLGQRSIQSVLVEGGAQVAGAFLDAKLVDKASFFIAPLIIGGCDAASAVGGTGAEKIAAAIRLGDVEFKQHGPDIEVTGYPIKDEG